MVTALEFFIFSILNRTSPLAGILSIMMQRLKKVYVIIENI